MDAKETLKQISNLLFKKAEKPVEEKPTETVETPTETTEEKPTEVVVSPGQTEAEILKRMQEAEEKLKKEQEDLKSQHEDTKQKLSALIEENKNRDEGLKKLLELVQFISEQPTEKPTEEKKDGVKNLLVNSKKAFRESFNK